MMAKKRATVGESIAKRWMVIDDGGGTVENATRTLARRIDAAIKRAVREAWMKRALHDLHKQLGDGHASMDVRNRVSTMYGVKL